MVVSRYNGLVLPAAAAAENGLLPFPLPSDLNTRLRRVITGYQRNHKKEQIKQEQKAKVTDSCQSQRQAVLWAGLLTLQ